jgi:Short C-terminal domain
VSTAVAVGLVVWFVSFVLAIGLGADKGRGWQGAVLGFFLGVIGLVIVWLLPSRPVRPFGEWEEEVPTSDAEPVKGPTDSAVAAARGGTAALPMIITAAPALDVADQIRKLAELRDRGILTDDEFAAQKARLLG